LFSAGSEAGAQPGGAAERLGISRATPYRLLAEKDAEKVSD